MSIKEKIKPFFSQEFLDAFGVLKAKILPIRLFFAGIYFTYFTKVYRTQGVVLNVPFEMTDFKFRGRFILNRYEREESKHLGNYLSPNAKVLELGSCLGFISCLTNKLIKDKDKHVVMEANPRLIEWIEKNKQENGCQFKIEHSIISSNAKNEFYIHDLIVGGSTKRATPHKVVVEGMSFSDLRKKYGIEFDTLILDIEGGELDLLRNHQADIADFDKIFIEIHPFSNILTKAEAAECEDILKKIGFNNILKDGNFQIWDKSRQN